MRTPILNLNQFSTELRNTEQSLEGVADWFTDYYVMKQIILVHWYCFDQI